MKKIELDSRSVIFTEYFSELKNKIFKILPMYEECTPSLNDYVASTLFELKGLAILLENQHNKYHLVSIISTLESIYDELYFLEYDNQKLIKSEVFRIISLISKMEDDSL